MNDCKITDLVSAMKKRYMGNIAEGSEDVLFKTESVNKVEGGERELLGFITKKLTCVGWPRVHSVSKE